MSTPPQEPEGQGQPGWDQPAQHVPQPHQYDHPYGQPQAPHLYGHPPAGHVPPNSPQGPGPYASHPQWPGPYAQVPAPVPQPRVQPLPDPKDRYSRGVWRQPDSRPGRFLWWDLLPVVPYLVLVVGVSLVSLMLFSPAEEISLTPEEARLEFLISGLTFGTLTVLILAVAGKALWRSLVVFTHHGLACLKLFLIPGLWVAIVGVNVLLMALVMALTGAEQDVSANQAGIEAMLQAAPFWAALLVLGLLAPLVEEYIFRHLLIGKLSRHLNIWFCAVISVVPFAFLHVSSELFAGDMQAVLMTVVPYLTMSIVFTLAYIFSGRSLLFVWLLHAFNNCMAVTLQYWLAPLLEDLEGIEPYGVILAAARALAGPLGLL